MNKHVKSNEPRTNERIRAQEIRVITEDGEVLGLLHPREGLRIARERGLDLVEVAPNAVPPVAKIMDYGKFKYAADKRPRAKVVETKEVQFRPNIGEHDFQVKLERAKRFLQAGDPVQVKINFKGRENAHRSLGQAIADRLLAELNGFCRIDKPATLEGSHILMTLAPSKLVQAKPAPSPISSPEPLAVG
jgi:translation initiation factor IF-3